MDGTLSVSLPISISDFDDISALKKVIAEQIIGNQGEFEPYFDRLIQMGDSRVKVIDDSLIIEMDDIDVDSTGGIACGTFDSDFYAGCKDMNSTSDHEVTLSFVIINGSLEFNIKLPPPWIPD